MRYKRWEADGGLAHKKFGQSYELYGQSILARELTDSADPRFGPDGRLQSNGASSLTLPELIAQNPEAVLGKRVVDAHGGMTLLIKFTQARGNSFQVHKKPDAPDAHWQPKAESWYFFEDGLISFGIRRGADLAAYRTACERIDATMHGLSAKVMDGSLGVAEAREQAKTLIQRENPWQFVNVHPVAKDGLVDLSGGGLHHSWEEDPASEFGNVVYEIQQDASDDVSSVRSFDQGKIKDDGTVRPIHLDAYFGFIDPDPERNDIANAIKTQRGNQLMATPHYSLDEITVSGQQAQQVGDSFEHLFVKEGAVRVVSAGQTLKLARGHSCFVPWGVGSYTLQSDSPATVLKTNV